MTRVRALLHGLASLTALVALIGGVPWALLRWGRLPDLSSGSWWSQLTDSAMSDTAVFAVLTVAAWAAWAIFAVSVAVEAVAGLRGLHAPHITLAGPLQLLARNLVVPVLILLSLAQHQPALASTSSPAGPLPSRADATTLIVDFNATPPEPTASTDPTVPEAPPPNATMTAAPAATAIVVERNDNPWRLAEEHLGDGMRWRELFDLNRGTPQPDGRAWTDPQVILPGWHLRLPATSAPVDDAASEPRHNGQVVYVVESGDTLSGIARDHLGDPARYAEIFDANRDREQPDGRRLTDPNLIRPGWHLYLPPETGAPPSTEAPTPPETAEAPIPDPTPTPDESARPPVTAPIPTAPSTVVPAPASTPTTVPSPTMPSTTVPSPPQTTGPHSTDEHGSSSPVPLMAGISGAVVLATGLALRIRTLRRRRATRGARHSHVPTIPAVEAVVAAADVPLVRWAGQHLARMVGTLDRRRLTAAPIAVELSEEAGLEVLWDDSQQAPAPVGWSVTDGGWAWRLAYDPEAPVPADELPAAIPALVTVGVRDGRQLMIDLEAFGVLTVSGPDERAEALVRSLAVELATGNDVSDAYVSTVGIDSGLDGHVDRVTVSDLDTAAQHADGARRSIRDVLDHVGINDTFRARAGDTTPIEATIVIAHSSGRDLPACLTSVPPRCGVAVVLSTDTSPTTGARILLDDTGLARLEPLGIEFIAAGMPRDSARRIDETLTALSQLPVDEADVQRPAPPTTSPAGSSNGHRRDGQVPYQPTSSAGIEGSGGNGHRSGPDLTTDDRALVGAATGLQPIERQQSLDAISDDAGLFHLDADSASLATAVPQMMVRVLGVPSVAERPELGRRELILTVLLACRGGSLAATAAQDALWGGKPVEAKTVWNFVAATRRALGEFEDGSPVMPSADRTRQTLRLDPRVTTDLAVFAHRVSLARESSTREAMMLLQDALGMVDGPPFDGAGYDWAHRDQDVTDASRLIEQAVEVLIDLATDAGQVDTARDAITRGLRGLPGNEKLYRCRMRVEHHAGNHAGIVAAYSELTVYLADLDTDPSPTTTGLFNELTRRQQP